MQLQEIHYNIDIPTDVDVLLKQRIEQIRFNIGVMSTIDLSDEGIDRINNLDKRLQELITTQNERDGKKIKRKK